MGDDWDEGTTTTKPASSFGGGFGRGFGRGALKQDGLSNGETGGSGGGGFGRGGGGFGRGTGGFGSSSMSNGVADDNTSGGASGSGFGSKRGGFGASRGGGFGSSSGGFGSKGFGQPGSSGGGSSGAADGDDWGSGGTETKRGGGGGGFGSRRGGFGTSNDSDDVPRGGGFGFGRGGSRGGGDGEKKGGGGCYKCGEDGHFARECPNEQSSGGRGGGSGACFKCNETGHMARDCPTAGSGGGGSGACFKCNETGHMARDCPTAGSGGGRGGGCYKCGEEGHMARDCTNEQAGGGRGGGDRACRKCGEEGHFARECPSAESSTDADGKPREAPYVPPPPPEDEEIIFDSMQKGINFSRYDDIPVECSGSNKPTTGIASFEQADLYEKFQENVRKAKYDKPTPIQKWAIPIILGGRDLMGCAQTGSGKTAAFLLPVLTGMMKAGLEGSSFSEIQTPQAIIIGPTRELVSQIYGEARKFAYGTMLRPVVVYGGTSVGHQLREVEKGAHMVIGTPGRLLDFINRGKIGLSKVKYLILDEADRMLDMGFEPEIRKLVTTMQLPAKEDRQTLMFSATFAKEIQELARDFLNDYLFVTVGRVGGANDDIEQNVVEVPHFEKRDKLISILNETGTDKTLIFVEQKRNADFLASYLSQSEFPTTSIHGDRLQREREEALADFKSNRAPILVATSVAARGLDIPNVKHVVNYDMPSTIDEYVHRIGRTGRCGNTGKATSFFDPDKDNELARTLVTILVEAKQEPPKWLEERAEQSFGTGFSGTGNKFGSRDTRRGGRGGRGGRDNDFGGNDAGFSFSSNSGGGAVADDDEAWD